MGLGLLEKGVFNARSVPIPHAQVTAATPPLPSSWSDRDASALVSAKVFSKINDVIILEMLWCHQFSLLTFANP